MFWKWNKGRQNTGYQKMKLFESIFLKMDMYIIKYNEGDYILKHKDTVDKNFNHHRLNLILKQSLEGGVFKINNEQILKRIIYFRPDIQEHEVSKIEKGKRYVLSIGWLTLKNNKK